MVVLCSFCKKYAIILISLCSVCSVNSQQTFPKIGDKLPDFVLNDLHYYPKKTAESGDFKGKPLIIDFFSLGCKACFISLPKMDSLKREFGNNVQFLLIGKRSPDLQRQYEKYMKHYKLDLPVDYDDSTIWNQFGVMPVPYTVWVDAKGYIREITTAFALNRARINNLLNGVNQSLSVAVNASDENNDNLYNNYFDNTKPLLIDGNGGADTSYLYRSVLCNWDYRTYFHNDMFISAGSRSLFTPPLYKNRIQEIGISLNFLLQLAFGDTVNSQLPRLLEDTSVNHYGLWARFPIIESSRKYLFQSDQDSVKNLFSYSMIMPDTNVSAKKLQHFMQSDLQNYFGFNVHVEIRKMPCWKIVLKNKLDNIFRTKGGKPTWQSSFSSLKLQNQSMHAVLVEIWSYHQNEPIFFDETGIDYNIDLDLNAVMTDMNEIKLELQKKGLDLVLGEKEMKVIVVKDAIDF